MSARIPHAVCVKLGVKMLSETVHENLKTLAPCPALDEAAASKLIAAIQSTEVLPAASMVSAHGLLQVAAAAQTCIIVEAQQRRESVAAPSIDDLQTKLSAPKIQFVQSVIMHSDSQALVTQVASAG